MTNDAERPHGVEIWTEDGTWFVRIHLAETELEGVPFEGHREVHPGGLFGCAWVGGDEFRGQAAARGLSTILAVFARWAYRVRTSGRELPEEIVDAFTHENAGSEWLPSHDIGPAGLDAPGWEVSRYVCFRRGSHGSEIRWGVGGLG